MAGLVWQWCSDWYGKNYYSNIPKSNPQGPDAGDEKVVRGGSDDDPALSIRCATATHTNSKNTKQSTPSI